MCACHVARTRVRRAKQNPDDMLPPRLDAPFLSSLQLSAPESLDAFNCVSEAEISAVHIYNQSGGKDMEAKGNVVASRVIGCLLHVFHGQHTSISDVATDAIRREILKSTQNRDSLVYDVGAMYCDHLLRACPFSLTSTCRPSRSLIISPKTYLRITPDSPESSSPISFDTIEEQLGQDLVSSILDYDTLHKNVCLPSFKASDIETIVGLGTGTRWIPLQAYPGVEIQPMR